jgi:hypothetical protein
MLAPVPLGRRYVQKLPPVAAGRRRDAGRLPPRAGRGGRYLAVASGCWVRRREVIRISFATLAVISLVAIVGPLLALPRRWHLPIISGELAAGIVLGATGSDRLQAHNETFTFLADIGFALIMFVVGSQVPVRDRGLHTALRIGALRAVGVGLLSVPLALVVARIFGTGHAALYAVLLGSSSAALTLPIVDSLGLGGRPVLQMMPQVAIADAACTVALSWPSIPNMPDARPLARWRCWPARPCCL